MITKKTIIALSFCAVTTYGADKGSFGELVRADYHKACYAVTKQVRNTVATYDIFKLARDAVVASNRYMSCQHYRLEEASRPPVQWSAADQKAADAACGALL